MFALEGVELGTMGLGLIALKQPEALAHSLRMLPNVRRFEMQLKPALRHLV